MVKVAILTNYPADHQSFTGGVETATAGLLEGFRSLAAELELHVIAAPAGLERSIDEERDGVFFHFLRSPRYLRPRFVGRMFGCLREIRTISPEIVHCQDAMAFAVAAILAGRVRVFSVHGVKRHEVRHRTGREKAGSRVDAAIERLVHSRFRAVICNSAYSKEAVGGSSPVFTVPNAVESCFFEAAAQPRDAGSPRPRLLFVGALAPLKRPGDLLEVHATLRREFPGLETELWGPIEDRAYARSLSRWLVSNGAEGVCLPGPIPHDRLPGLLRSATVMVLPSAQENVPMVVAEAMAAGVPVVASRVGGVAEMVRHGETGLLVEPGNVEALTASVRTLLRGPQMRRKMGERARKVAAATFDPANVARATLSVYREVLARQGNGRAS